MFWNIQPIKAFSDRANSLSKSLQTVHKRIPYQKLKVPALLLLGLLFGLCAKMLTQRNFLLQQEHQNGPDATFWKRTLIENKYFESNTIQILVEFEAQNNPNNSNDLTNSLWSSQDLNWVLIYPPKTEDSPQSPLVFCKNCSPQQNINWSLVATGWKAFAEIHKKWSILPPVTPLKKPKPSANPRELLY